MSNFEFRGNKPLPSGLAGIKFNVPRFVKHNRPDGFLCDTAACHAVFYYATTMRLSYEGNELGFDLQYEGEAVEPALWNHSNFRQAWETISFIYGVDESEMVRHWACVDMQFFASNIPALPDEERYRFNRVSAVVIDINSLKQKETSSNENKHNSNSNIRNYVEQSRLSGSEADDNSSDAGS